MGIVRSMVRRTACALLPGVLLLTVSAGALESEKFGLDNPNAPIEVTADRFDADKTSRTVLYTGHAVVRQSNMYLHTDTLRVVVPDGKTPDKIYARGHVVVTSTSGTATGDAGVYDVGPRVITLTGHVVLTRGDNVMRGEQLTVNLVSGVADLGGAPKGGRIQGMFTPKDISNDTSGNPGGNSGANPGNKADATKPAPKN